MERCTKHDRGALAEAVGWLVDDKMFSNYKRHGNTDWSFPALVSMALFWSWGDATSLQERFGHGRQLLARLFPRRQWGRTYQSFVKMLQTWSGRLQGALVARLRQRMHELADRRHTCHGRVVMAVDGTRVEVPRTAACLQHFNRPASHNRRKPRRRRPRKNQRRPTAPQIWLTVVWHIGLGVLWDWRRGPSGSSERAHLREMLDALPERTLLVTDAGFQGYDFWRELLEKGHAFVIRVGRNVKLLKGLGHARRRKDIVCLWPDQARRRHDPPLVLRLHEFHDGRRSVWLVTSITDRQELPAQAVREIYRQRWGVEVFIRGFKQTFGKARLRSRAPQNAELELDWSLLALWSLELLAVRELLARGRSPHDLSTAGALRSIRRAMHCAALGVGCDLFSRLAAIRNDGYRRRNKAIRDWPGKTSRTPPGRPVIRYASSEQLQTAWELQPSAA